MNFAEALKNVGSLTTTENGAIALNTTGDKLLDLFSTIGALRNTDEDRIERLFAEAYKENPLFATKIAFYGRDITDGLGERRTFRTIIRYMANYYPEALRPNLDLIGVYGRYDDLYSLIDTPLEDEMWATMKKQFEEDREGLRTGKCISLLAKWIKTADASSEKTRKLGILTAKKLGYKVYYFKRIVRAMRKKIGIVEALMSAGRWEEIDYPTVPSRAMLLYRSAFMRHDKEGFDSFVKKAVKGEVKINSSTLYPYDLVGKILHCGWTVKIIDDDTVEAQWRQLPNYVEEGTNALVIADTSGSMEGRPLNTAIGLAIYFAERNKGAYHNLWMSFSANANIHSLKGTTLAQKLRSIDMRDWHSNTDLKSAFSKILDIAIKNNVSQEEMVKSLVVISDMEIDVCTNRDWLFYDEMKAKFTEHGYEMPNVTFWNVDSRHDTFHADGKRKGVQLVSGQSTTVFKQVMDCIGMTPLEAMVKVISSDRYNSITVDV